MYWANVSQYFDFRLDRIDEDYDFETAQVKKYCRGKKERRRMTF